AGRGADQGGAQPGEGLVRAEPRQGRPPAARAGPPDRRGEDARPERAGRGAGDEGDRRDRPLDGRGGGAVMGAHGKKYRAARGAIDREQAYTPLEAIKMLKGWDGPTFDETVEAHVRLGLNVRHADQ